jgi:myo-inositol 2-dehydrogenase / D-chiro-inositol 1-dehydrogenase
MTAELRLGLVGCGRIAEHGWTQVARLAPDVTLAAVADLDRERCRRVAPGIPAYRDAEQLVASGRVDAVVVATPAASHVADARAAARAGLPTLVEKPPAATSEEARALALLDPLPRIGFNRRFVPGVARLQPIGRRGDSTQLKLRLDARRAAWRAYVADDDVLLDLGTHLVDLARWLTGRDVGRVRALELGTSRATLELDHGSARARIVCAHDRRYREQVELKADGDGGRYRAPGAARGLLRRVLHPRRPNPLVASLAAELEAFAAVARGDAARVLATATDGVAAMAAIDAARRSAASGSRWCEPEIPGP